MSKLVIYQTTDIHGYILPTDFLGTREWGLAKIAALCMTGKSLLEQNALEEKVPEFYSVKESVFPFVKFPGVDPILGPEMKSTGEAMGIGKTFGEAFAKSQLSASVTLPKSGTGKP